ncbi:MAG: hypothetical protein A2249_02850 [Candidatus Jacksonbacteria bacterium RIFOXYA2_FULL_44_7]|nr:MAG: hypothetical protein A2249_02850 [Candidatus Jacksonbacteria bacterium RIFOXYA2_FULL_44_7]
MGLGWKTNNQKNLVMKGLAFSHYPGLNDWPVDIYNAYSDVWVNVGPKDEKWIDTYEFYVCTIKKFREGIKTHQFAFGRHTLIVEKFDYDLIKKAIEGILPEIEKYGDDVT